MGLMIFPSSIPKLYQSRFKGRSLLGEIKARSANTTAAPMKMADHTKLTTQANHPAARRKTAQKNQPNFVSLGSPIGLVAGSDEVFRGIVFYLFFTTVRLFENKINWLGLSWIFIV